MNFICEENASCNVDCDESVGRWCPIQFSNQSLNQFQPLIGVDSMYFPDWFSVYKNTEYGTSNSFDIESYYNELCLLSCKDLNNCTVLDYNNFNTTIMMKNLDENRGPNANALCMLQSTFESFTTIDSIDIIGHDYISPGMYILN